MRIPPTQEVAMSLRSVQHPNELKDPVVYELHRRPEMRGGCPKKEKESWLTWNVRGEHTEDNGKEKVAKNTVSFEATPYLQL
ncbi:hypothetical protein NDU88_004427 [Pleurodeles waltl]|uniref:Uncharacterized protein n=1 Tax=Pleurodeles waltl TaxID=8319 RepID=A0AAV7QBX1_PLEWA|nr:hypothetical protein NDU88_004427 [Pleurodeles waltl]